MLWAPINKDAGYFLSTARAIASGDSPYREVAMRYPPLAMLFFALVGKIVGFGQYKFFVAAVLLVQALNTWMVYRLAGRFFAHRALQSLTAALYLLAFFLNDGPFVLLEPFVVLGALAAAVCFWEAREKGGAPVWLLLAGMACGCSVMSKQYGLAPVGMIGAAVLLDASATLPQRLLRAAWMALGGALFAAVFFGGFYVWSGIGPGELLGALLSAGDDYGYKHLDWAIKFTVKHLLLHFPTLLLLAFVPPRTAARSLAFWWLALSLGASFLPLYFKQYPHYTQIYLPYAALLAHWALGQWAQHRSTGFVYVRWAGVALGLWLCLQSVFLVKIWRENDESAKLAVLAERARTLVPNQEKCMLYGVQHLYYMADLQPADKAKYGFRFRPPWHTDPNILREVSLVLIDRSKIDQKPAPPDAETLKTAGFALLEYSPSHPSLEWWSRPR